MLVNGFPATNPASLVAPGSVALRRERPLRGEAKLRAALDAFSVEVAGRTAPQFELGLAEPPRARRLLDAAVTRARAGFEACGWRIADSMPSPIRGARGSVEYLLLARRVETGDKTPDTCPAARDSRDRAPLGEQR